jgi:hypothetical protein
MVENLLGLEPVHLETDFVVYTAPNNDDVELYGPSFPGNRYFTTGPVPGFEVPDLEVAKARVLELDYELLSGIEGNPGDVNWVHFRGPDGNVYELTHHPSRRSAG